VPDGFSAILNACAMLQRTSSAAENAWHASHRFTAWRQVVKGE